MPPAGWRRAIGDRHPDPFRAKTVPDPLTDDGPVQGLPLGGLGTGSIGRDHDGRFSRWHLVPGHARYRPAAGSWLGIELAGTPSGPDVPPPPASGGGSSGPLALVAAGTETRPAGLAPAAGPVGEYEALFPFARYRYRPELTWGVEVQVRQWSPVLPGREDVSCWPAGCFEVELRSGRDQPCEVTVALVFELPLEEAGLDAHAVELWAAGGTAGARLPGGPASFAVAAEAPEGGVIAATALGTRGYDALAGGLWEAISAPPAAEAFEPGSGIAAAARLRLEPGETRTVALALAWDMPLIRFGEHGEHAWYRAHTRRFGREGMAAAEIAEAMLAARGEIGDGIEGWHADLADRLERWGAPAWMLPALCNELYVMVEGGTAWVVGARGGAADEEHFAVLESVDYRYYETLDVRYYSSFALLELWPRLERLVVAEYVRTLSIEDDRAIRAQWNGQDMPRKRRDAAPHDLGGPLADPFRRVNAYDLHDSGDWRDLNPKLVLQVARDAILLGDEGLARDAWPACRQAIRYVEAFDADGDGVPEHDGSPGQTFDTWPMTGLSAYCGDIWLACLAAGAWLARLAGDQAEADRLTTMRERAQPVLERELWTGTHYRFDASGGPTSDVVLAGQLAGTWYSLLLGLPAPHPEGRAARALETVLAANFRGFAGGRLGPVNGRMADGGQPGVESEQADEVWVGVAWTIASLALLMGRDEEAWSVGEALYRTLYEESGLWFRTPEAWTEDRRFRAGVYHRPLSVWSLVTTLRLRANAS